VGRSAFGSTRESHRMGAQACRRIAVSTASEVALTWPQRSPALSFRKKRYPQIRWASLWTNRLFHGAPAACVTAQAIGSECIIAWQHHALGACRFTFNLSLLNLHLALESAWD
jgi:hypothetical protein